MRYFEVAPASAQYHGRSGLTYGSANNLVAGEVVVVPLRRQKVLGIVLGPAAQPKNMSVKAIDKLVCRLPKTSLTLLNWLRDYYPAPLGATVQLFLPRWLLSGFNESNQPQAPTKSQVMPPLTEEQQKILNKIERSASASFLLHGITGSGKTRIYIELAKASLKNHRSAVILTPEISLTPQLIKRFTAVFPGRVLLTHSGLTIKQRRAAWWQALNGPAQVVIGPRSALFLPLKEIGLIVMDEAHEPAYKSEQLPNYQTSRVAGALAKLHGARFVMGSATPLVQDYFMVSAKNVPVLNMKSLALKSPSRRQIKLVDLRDRKQFSRQAFLSTDLLQAVEGALTRSEQVLIFLNRRGSARLVLCQNCGWRAGCPRCNLPLVYHGDQHSLKCHNCGYQTTPPPACPVCGHTDIIFKGIGTKALELSLRRLFPRARLARFDTDNPKAERLDTSFMPVADGKVDILVGTQILAKGLDLPRLSVVGVVLADSSLSFPDYTADERTYQLLAQVCGRVGRGHRDGEVIIQTYDPEHPVIKAVLEDDYKSFYNHQLDLRRAFGFPPFNYLLKLQIEKASPKIAAAKAEDLISRLRADKSLGVEFWGPAPSFQEKSANRYRWQIVAKAKRRTDLIKIIDQLTPDWRYDLDPNNLL